MSIENSKNYTGYEDVYRNMNKERELLERALLLLDYSEMRSDSLATEIELCLAEPEEEPLNLNCKSVQKRLVTQWGYSISGKREPLSEKEIEEINKSIHPKTDLPTAKILFARAIEKYHGIGGEDEAHS